LDLSSSKVAGFFPALGALSTATLLVLVVFDVGYWPKPYLFYLGRFLITFCLIGYALTALVCTRYFAGAAIAVYLVFTPALLYIIKLAVLNHMPTIDFFWVG
jgi:hypothetical protein